MNPEGSQSAMLLSAGNPEHIVMFETASEEIRLHYLYPLLRKVDSAILLNPILVNRWVSLRSEQLEY